jgi:hypothetical protein
MSRHVARSLAALIDDATPYRPGQMSLQERALHALPRWHTWSAWLALVASAGLAGASYL